MSRNRKHCPITCQCICHDTGGYAWDEHGPNGGPCSGKSLTDTDIPQPGEPTMNLLAAEKPGWQDLAWRFFHRRS